MNPDQRINKATLTHPINLHGVMRITKPAVTWEQLHHAPDAMLGLKKICQAFKPGQSLMFLFTGAWHGQTLAAQAIATQLGLALVHVDLSTLVSKYIGETEKNLQHVFDSANPQNSVLFFDETDALFGKRTEVKDSHDRYANVDTNDLLQRIEAFEGLVILVSNRKQALDSAFMRRIRRVIDFPA